LVQYTSSLTTIVPAASVDGFSIGSAFDSPPALDGRRLLYWQSGNRGGAGCVNNSVGRCRLRGARGGRGRVGRGVSLLGPIFNREWLTVPRRSSHYFVRSAYLGTIWAVGVAAWQMTVGWGRMPTLGDASRFGLLLFEVLTGVQLVLLVFFAALSAASAVMLEKDRRTFVLLLLTDLRSYEIVLGKLLGSLLPIVLLLLGMLPVLALLILLGGVSLAQVGQMAVVLATAILAAGSLGNLVALWRDRTFQVLALTVLLLVLYLCLVFQPAALVAVGVAGLGAWAVQAALPPTRRSTPFRIVLLVLGLGVAAVAAAAAGTYLASAAWFQAATPTVQTWLSPFHAWLTVLGTVPSEEGVLAPAYGFAVAMLLVSVLLNVWGILRLRVWNPSGEPIMQREAPEAAEEEKDRARAHAAPGAVRQVWANPILWREICTRAYGRRPLLVKLAYALVVGLICSYALSGLGAPGEHLGIRPALGLVAVAVLSLLLVSAQAVTAITSERDTGALDLLLVTDLTPKEFIFGKLGGILWNALLFALPPLLLAAYYGHHGLLATPPRTHPELLAYRNAEALVSAWGVSLVLLAFALVLGVHVALRNQHSRVAILNTLGTIFFLSVGTGVCIVLILINGGSGGRFEYQWLSFLFFILAGILGLWWVLSGDRPSAALTLAAWLCPLAVFYSVVNILVGKPGTEETADPMMPLVVMTVAFGFTVAAMVVPLVSEFDVALGRTTAGGE
jgi:ABC-type transport system involved in multi-copper enzyme maturation permease subunit